MLNPPSLQNNTTNVVIQQNSRELLMMDILMSETCWAHKKWNKIASDITLVFYSSTYILDSKINFNIIYVWLFNDVAQLQVFSSLLSRAVTYPPPPFNLLQSDTPGVVMKNSFHAPRKTHYISITKTVWLALFTEITNDYSQSHAK